MVTGEIGNAYRLRFSSVTVKTFKTSFAERDVTIRLSFLKRHHCLATKFMLKLGLKSMRVFYHDMPVALSTKLDCRTEWPNTAKMCILDLFQLCFEWTNLSNKRYDEQSYLICLYEHFCYVLTAFINEKCICKCFRKQSYIYKLYKAEFL